MDPAIRNATIYGCQGITDFIKLQLKAPDGMSDSRYTIAAVADRPVALVELRVLPDSLFLNYISVDIRHRGSGVAKRLLRAAIEFARCPEHLSISLDVLDGNEVPLRWYERLGFRRSSVTEWWDLEKATVKSSGRGYVSGYSQAFVCQREFGFSTFDITTPRARFQVGQLGCEYFRITRAEALLDEDLWAALYCMDPNRRILAQLPEGALAGHLRDQGRLLARFHRMVVDLDTVMAKLQ